MPAHRQSFMRVLWIGTLLGLSSLLTQSAPADEAGLRWLRDYCRDCHSDGGDEKDLRIDVIARDPGDSEAGQSARSTWHAMLRRIRAREMPPEDADQPTEEQRAAMVQWIVNRYGDLESPPTHWSFTPPMRPPVPQPSGPDRFDPDNPIDAFVRRKLDQVGLTPSPVADRRTLLRRVSLDLTGLPPTLDQTEAFLKDAAPLPEAYSRVVDRLLDSPRYGERWAQHWLDVIRWAETVGFETNGERTDAWHYRDWVIEAFNQDMPYDEFIRRQLCGDATGDDAALGFLVAGPANLPGQIGRDEEAMRQARQDELDEVIRTVSQGLFGLTIGCARCHDHKFDPISQQDYYRMQAIFAGLQYGYRRLRGPRNDAWSDQLPDARSRLSELRRELASLQREFGLREPLGNVHTETFAPTATDAIRMEIAATTGGPPSMYEFEVWSLAKEGSESRNVALARQGAVPSASSFALANQTRHFENLIDGSVDRRQAFPWVAAQAAPAWIQIDLASTQIIDRVVWHSGSSVPADYQIQVRDPDSRQWTTVAHTRDRLPRIDDRRPAAEVHLEGVSNDQVGRLIGLIGRIRNQEREVGRLAAGPQTYAASFHESPEPTYLLRRGDPMQPVQEVFAAVPGVLMSDQVSGNPEHELERRQRLVDHLTHPQHPLTARVMVNRIWQHHFGVGLVETASDFGRMGAAPTHPELLDWLAVEFVEGGWSLKHLHRLMVTSQTYLQSSRPDERGLEKDAENRLLWRYPPRRLEAEAIRDSILMVSGKLNLQMHGQGFDLFDRRGGLSDYTPKETFSDQGWRRMIYAHKIRMQTVDVFGAFDCPDAGQMTPRRNQSITPVQSLGLFNSPFVMRQADFFAQRVTDIAGDDSQSAIRLAFEMAFARLPTDEELRVMTTLAERHGMRQVCRVILNASEFIFFN